jgi:hypothetical protein
MMTKQQELDYVKVENGIFHLFAKDAGRGISPEKLANHCKIDEDFVEECLETLLEKNQLNSWVHNNTTYYGPRNTKRNEVKQVLNELRDDKKRQEFAKNEESKTGKPIQLKVKPLWKDNGKKTIMILLLETVPTDKYVDTHWINKNAPVSTSNVSSVMHNLHKKGFVTRQKTQVGRTRYLYRRIRNDDGTLIMPESKENSQVETGKKRISLPNKPTPKEKQYFDYFNVDDVKVKQVPLKRRSVEIKQQDNLESTLQAFTGKFDLNITHQKLDSMIKTLSDEIEKREVELKTIKTAKLRCLYEKKKKLESDFELLERFNG